VDWHLYLDESYNNRTFCVGGLLAPVEMWQDIESKWKERLDYESRISFKKGFPRISRYHATDCANLKREFDKKKGWTIDRQILLTKRLCEILVKAGPIALAYGGSLAAVQETFGTDPNLAKQVLYKAAVLMHMIVVEEIFTRRFPSSRVQIFCDRNTDFGALAENAFRDALQEPRAIELGLAKYFSGLQQVGWEDHIALQPADFIAYEGMRRFDEYARGKEEARKTLRSLKAANTMPIRMEYFTEQNFRDIRKMNQNKSDGKLISDGVESKLAISDTQPGGLFD
jgi:hypothetical protein